MLKFETEQQSATSQSASRRDGTTSGLRLIAKRAQCFVKNTTSCAVRRPLWIGRPTCRNGMTSFKGGPRPHPPGRPGYIQYSTYYLLYQVGLVTMCEYC